MKRKKLKIGWFSFTCCEDSTILFIELLNDYWDKWKNLLDFKYIKILKSNNVLDDLDVAFVEGAISSKSQEQKLRQIRKACKKLVAIGSCAVTSRPSAHRNEFPKEIRKEIEFLIKRFHYGKKVKKLSEVVKVDEQVNGCPMDEEEFLQILNKLLKEFEVI